LADFRNCLTIHQNPLFMNKLVLLPVVFFLFTGCTQLAEKGKKEHDETAKQNLELVKKMVQAYENEDMAALREIYSPDLQSVGPQVKYDFPYDTIMASNEDWFKQADSIKFDVDIMLPEIVKEGDLAGNWVLLWADISWYDLKSGKKLKVMYHSPLRIENGRIVFEAAFWDEWDAFKQLGAKLEWPDADEKDM
jgi:ketosteroid isomerase-like protein